MCLRSTVEGIITIPLISQQSPWLLFPLTQSCLWLDRCNLHHILSQYLLRDIRLPGKTGEITKWTFDAQTIQLWDEEPLATQQRVTVVPCSISIVPKRSLKGKFDHQRVINVLYNPSIFSSYFFHTVLSFLWSIEDVCGRYALTICR